MVDHTTHSNPPTILGLHQVPMISDTGTSPSTGGHPLTRTNGQHGEKRKVFFHQADAINRLGTMAHALLAYDMGLGKTLILIQALSNRNTPKAIVVTKAALLDHWQFEANLEDMPIYRLSDRDTESTIAEFSIATRGILLMSFERLVSNVSTINKYIVNSFVYPQLIIDECHLLANPISQRTQACGMLHKSGVWLSTGTPIMNGTEDLFSTLTLLQVWDGSLPKFRKEFMKISYSIKNPYTRKNIDIWIPQDNGPSRLHALLEPVTLRMIGDKLKPQVETKLITFNEPKREYEEIPDFNEQLANLTRKRIAYATVIERSPRTDVLYHILKYLESESQMLLVTSFEIVARDLVKLLTTWGYKTGIIAGTKTHKARTQTIAQANVQAIQILVVVNQAGREGLNLPSFQSIVFWDGDWTDSGHHQIIDRIRRITSRHPTVRVYELLGSESPDQELLAVRKQKERITSAFWNNELLSNTVVPTLSARSSSVESSVEDFQGSDFLRLLQGQVQGSKS